MQSLHINKFTNILLLLHAVCHQIPLALPAPRKIERTKGVIRWKFFEYVGALESIGPIAMHEDDTNVRIIDLFEDRSIQFLIILVSDAMHLMLDIAHVEQILYLTAKIQRLNSE